MKIKLDENLSRHLKPILVGFEHDVLTAADEASCRARIQKWLQPLSEKDECYSPLTLSLPIFESIRQALIRA